MSLLRSSHIALREGHKAISIGRDFAAVPGVLERAGNHSPGSAGNNRHGHGGLETQVIYRSTCLSGRIHFDMDLTGSVGCFGSPDSRIIGRDFTRELRRDFTVRKRSCGNLTLLQKGDVGLGGKDSSGQ